MLCTKWNKIEKSFWNRILYYRSFSCKFPLDLSHHQEIMTVYFDIFKYWRDWPNKEYFRIAAKLVELPHLTENRINPRTYGLQNSWLKSWFQQNSSHSFFLTLLIRFWLFCIVIIVRNLGQLKYYFYENLL